MEFRSFCALPEHHTNVLFMFYRIKPLAIMNNISIKELRWLGIDHKDKKKSVCSDTTVMVIILLCIK